MSSWDRNNTDYDAWVIDQCAQRLDEVEATLNEYLENTGTEYVLSYLSRRYFALFKLLENAD